jgi:hypothetical protein
MAVGLISYNVMRPLSVDELFLKVTFCLSLSEVGFKVDRCNKIDPKIFNVDSTYQI